MSILDLSIDVMERMVSSIKFLLMKEKIIDRIIDEIQRHSALGRKDPGRRRHRSSLSHHDCAFQPSTRVGAAKMELQAHATIPTKKPVLVHPRRLGRKPDRR